MLVIFFFYRSMKKLQGMFSYFSKHQVFSYVDASWESFMQLKQFLMQTVKYQITIYQCGKHNGNLARVTMHIQVKTKNGGSDIKKNQDRHLYQTLFYWGDGDLTLVLRKGGGCCNPRDVSPDILFLIGNRRLPKGYNASFHKNESKFGGALWVGGVLKVFGRGVGETLILPITKIFDKI